MQPGTQIIIPFLLAYVGGFIYFLVKGYRNANGKEKQYSNKVKDTQ